MFKYFLIEHCHFQTLPLDSSIYRGHIGMKQNTKTGLVVYSYFGVLPIGVLLRNVIKRLMH